MNKKICVFCSSSSKVNQEFIDTAVQLGRMIGERKDILVYGGTNEGLMKYLANAVKQNGGKVIGVIPETLKHLSNGLIDQIHITKTMHERKGKMEGFADAFIALPGGFGTLDELIETITLKQLQYHNNPVVIINTRDFFQYLIRHFDEIYRENLANTALKEYYYIAKNSDDALKYIDQYIPVDFTRKLFQ